MAKTTNTASSVPSGAAACDTFRLVGSMYGHCATPQPITTVATAPIESARAPRALRKSSSSDPAPHSADRITNGSARDASPSNT